jgi:hypothetical protein
MDDDDLTLSPDFASRSAVGTARLASFTSSRHPQSARPSPMNSRALSAVEPWRPSSCG